MTGRGWTRLLWRWHYPGESVSIRIEQISRSPTCLEFSPTAKEHLPCVRWTVALSDVLKRGLFRSSPNQVACTSKPTRSLLVLHTWNAAGELERNRLSHLASPWIFILLPLTCKSTTWKLPSKAKRANRLCQPPGWICNNTEPQPPTSIKQKERSRNREKAQIFYHKQDWSAQPLAFWKLSKVIQCQTFSIRTGIYPTHPLPNVVRIFRKVR